MFNVESNKNIRLNTGFVREDWYEVIKQIMLTRNAWIKENGTYYPVMPKVDSMASSSHPKGSSSENQTYFQIVRLADT